MPNMEGKSLFPPSTEAFTVTEYDNNSIKWSKTVDFFNQEGNNFATTLPAKKTKEEREQPGNDHDALHDAKYTRTNGGQKRFGSYLKEGLEYFGMTQKKLKKIKKDHPVQTLEWEENFLQLLRTADGVGDDGVPTTGKGGKKRKIPGQGGPKKRAKVVLCFDSDDEDEEEMPERVATSPSSNDDDEDSEATTLDDDGDDEEDE